MQNGVINEHNNSKSDFSRFERVISNTFINIQMTVK